MNNTKWWSRAVAGAASGLSLVLFALLLMQFVRQSPSPATSSPDAASQATVRSVIDGDTLVLSIAGQQERVRLVGIDTPETVATNTPEQCYGAEASQALQGLVAPGDVVTIASDTQRRDRFGRLLLYVHNSEGVFINEWLVSSGFADIMFFEPNTALRPQFTGARNLARASQIGLWAHCDGPDQPLN